MLSEKRISESLCCYFKGKSRDLIPSKMEFYMGLNNKNSPASVVFSVLMDDLYVGYQILFQNSYKIVRTP